MRSSAFSAAEIQASVLFAMAVEVVFALSLTMVSATQSVPEAVTPPERLIPISVRPVIDEEMLLKKGHKLDKAKLPDIWRKQPTKKKFNELSAPSPLADQAPAAIPSSEIAKENQEAPPPEAEITQEPLDELAEADVPDLNVEEVGSEDGIVGGKEIDPLKVNAVAMYTARLSAWFKRGFNIPPGEIPCEVLKTLRATAEAQLSDDLFVTSVNILSPSGNAAFDARVAAAINSKVGQPVPPPTALP